MKRSTSAAAARKTAGQTRLRQKERLGAAANGKKRARVQGQEREVVSKRDVVEPGKRKSIEYEHSKSAARKSERVGKAVLMRERRTARQRAKEMVEPARARGSEQKRCE